MRRGKVSRILTFDQDRYGQHSHIGDDISEATEHRLSGRAGYLDLLECFRKGSRLRELLQVLLPDRGRLV